MNVSRYYDYLSKKPCLRCNRYGTEVCHVRAFASNKTRDLLPRSHKGLAAWSAVSLCPDCHRLAPDALHNVGEDAFFDNLGKSRCFVFATVARTIAEFASES